MPKRRSIEQIRAEIDAARQRLDELADERLTADELHETIRERLSAETPFFNLERTAGTSATAGGIREHLASLSHPGDRTGVGSHVLTLGDLAAILGPDDVAQRVTAVLADHCGELSGPDRQSAQEAARSQLYALELEEAQAITAAEEAGQPVTPRADADPAAVLEAWK